MSAAGGDPLLDGCAAEEQIRFRFGLLFFQEESRCLKGLDSKFFLRAVCSPSTIHYDKTDSVKLTNGLIAAKAWHISATFVTGKGTGS